MAAAYYVVSSVAAFCNYHNLTVECVVSGLQNTKVEAYSEKSSVQGSCHLLKTDSDFLFTVLVYSYTFRRFILTHLEDFVLSSVLSLWSLFVTIDLQVKVDEIREMFAAVGFVWDVVIPQNPETGYFYEYLYLSLTYSSLYFCYFSSYPMFLFPFFRLSKGFAFVKFTSKQDAENVRFPAKNVIQSLLFGDVVH